MHNFAGEVKLCKAGAKKYVSILIYCAMIDIDAEYGFFRPVIKLLVKNKNQRSDQESVSDDQKPYQNPYKIPNQIPGL
jgi:hypothetical protein